MKSAIIYTTVPNLKEAKSICKVLVKERLVACANIFPINSVYRWKGRIEQAKECAIVLKTRSNLVKSVINRVKGLHSYECPCILSFDIKDGNKAFLKWVEKETQV